MYKIIVDANLRNNELIVIPLCAFLYLFTCLVKVPFLWVHGREDFTFSSEQRGVLRQYIENGGVLHYVLRNLARAA